MANFEVFDRFEIKKDVVTVTTVTRLLKASLAKHYDESKITVTSTGITVKGNLKSIWERAITKAEAQVKIEGNQLSYRVDGSSSLGGWSWVWAVLGLFTGIFLIWFAVDLVEYLICRDRPKKYFEEAFKAVEFHIADINVRPGGPLMSCTGCGAKIADGLKFCGNCGKPQSGESNHAVPPSVAVAPAHDTLQAILSTVAVPAPPPPTVAVPGPPPPTTALPPLPSIERATAFPNAQDRSRQKPVTQPAPSTPRASPSHSRGSRRMVFVVVALLIVGVVAGYFYFSLSRATHTTVTTSPAVVGEGSLPEVVTRPPVAQPTTTATEPASNQDKPADPSSPTVTASNGNSGADAEALIQAATTGDVARIETIISELESQPRAMASDRKAARQLNDQALALLRAERYAEAIPVLEQARLADESDAEVAGNLADTLMRVGRLDDASRVALVQLRLAPRRTVAWSLIGVLSAKRDDASVAVACLVTGYRFSNVQQATLRVYSRLAKTDEDPKVRAALQEAVKRITESQMKRQM